MAELMAGAARGEYLAAAVDDVEGVGVLRLRI